MSKEEIKYNMVEDIACYLKYILLSTIDEEPDKLPIFNNVLNIISCMNSTNYTYTLKCIDNKLFDKLILEVINILL